MGRRLARTYESSVTIDGEVLEINLRPWWRKVVAALQVSILFPFVIYVFNSVVPGLAWIGWEVWASNSMVWIQALFHACIVFGEIYVLVGFREIRLSLNEDKFVYIKGNLFRRVVVEDSFHDSTKIVIISKEEQVFFYKHVRYEVRLENSGEGWDALIVKYPKFGLFPWGFHPRDYAMKIGEQIASLAGLPVEDRSRKPLSPLESDQKAL